MDVLVVPVGVLVQLLASDPATAVATAIALKDQLARLRIFRRRNVDPLQGLSARQALEVLREHARTPEELAGGEADADVNLGSAPYRHRIPAGYLRRPDGTVVSGRVITVVSKYEDGTTDYIHVEG